MEYIYEHSHLAALHCNISVQVIIKTVFAWSTYKMNALEAVEVLHLQMQLHVNELQNKHVYFSINFILIDVYDPARQCVW